MSVLIHCRFSGSALSRIFEISSGVAEADEEQATSRSMTAYRTSQSTAAQASSYAGPYSELASKLKHTKLKRSDPVFLTTLTTGGKVSYVIVDDNESFLGLLAADPKRAAFDFVIYEGEIDAEKGMAADKPLIQEAASSTVAPVQPVQQSNEAEAQNDFLSTVQHDSGSSRQSSTIRSQSKASSFDMVDSDDDDDDYMY